MARTTDELVEGIIDVDSTIPLTPFIDAANALVTQCCTNLTIDYETEQLTMIETWLAAHMYTVRDMRAVSEKAGSVAEKFQSKVDLGFSTSHYGQMAMRLDFYGGLANLDEQSKNGVRQAPSVTYLGKNRCEADDNVC
jgi:hypothetical protein